MKASDYFQLVSNPEAWLYRSIGLRAAADQLMGVATTQRGIEETRESFINDFAYCEACEAAKLLYGLSLETALKSAVIRKGGNVAVNAEMASDGTLVSVQLRTAGLDTQTGNNLRTLAQQAAEGDRTLTLLLRHARLLPLLDELSEAVLWRSRYPVAPKPAVYPPSGTFMEDRRLLLQVLDELQKDSVWFRFLGNTGRVPLRRPY